MLEMKITITAEDVVIAAINNLAKALEKAEPRTVFTQNGENNTQNAGTAPANPTPAPKAPAQATGVPLSATPAQTAAPVAPTVPVATPAPTAAPAPVPTAAPQYTLEMISVAGSALIDAGKLDALMALLGKYGVDSLTSLDPNQYGAVATDLRALGARI